MQKDSHNVYAITVDDKGREVLDAPVDPLPHQGLVF